MKTKAKSKRYLDSVELFTTIMESSDYGTETPLELSIGKFGANIEQIKGSRFERYKQFGYTHLIIVRMYAVDTPFNTIEWRGKRLQVRSIIEDKNNTTKIVIYADIIN